MKLPVNPSTSSGFSPKLSYRKILRIVNNSEPAYRQAGLPNYEVTR